MHMISPSIRERAFDAAQRLVLSQPHMAIGQLDQKRLAEWVIEIAGVFETWMRQPADEADTALEEFFDGSMAAKAANQAGEQCSSSQADPAIDAYIESDRRVMAMMEKLKPIDTDTIARGCVQGMQEICARIEAFTVVANAIRRPDRNL